MNYWLVKFAPFRYSWRDVLKNGKFEIYSVRNPQAKNNLSLMSLGDQALFYHSQEGHEVLGMMKVIEEAHQDPTTTDSKWISVTFEPVRSLENPVSLKKIKCEPKLSEIGLIKQQRLAVMRLNREEFEMILILAKA
ncbi:EVE domain-containing protein [Cyclobacterium sp. SYSU L10401]|uniref:EVE domain-containing protein n=1 Tax=Cyclobacterium sp. SYSU L10401 TaxID=2678657 RepID=UPI0013D3AEFA|nr:EVE domain-containing protein [Cyclobacterium sp. SYSU L10401]